MNLLRTLLGVKRYRINVKIIDLFLTKINFNYLLQVVKAEQLMYYNSDDKSGYVEVIHVEIYGDSLKADPGIDVVESICDTIRTNWPGCG